MNQPGRKADVLCLTCANTPGVWEYLTYRAAGFAGGETD